MNKLFKEILPYIIILIIVILIRSFFFSIVVVHGTSMTDTLHENDVMILNKIGLKTKKVKRFDIVVVYANGKRLIKRVIGLPGEEIEYIDKVLYINGEKVNDPYENGYTPDIIKTKLINDEYFVLGDNRGDSYDSSEIGPIKKKQLLGRANLVIFPFNRFGNK